MRKPVFLVIGHRHSGYESSEPRAKWLHGGNRLKRSYLYILELLFLAGALTFFVPIPLSTPAPYAYFPAASYLAIVVCISRFCSYKNGRSGIVCSLEALIIVAFFLAHVWALNYVTGRA